MSSFPTTSRSHKIKNGLGSNQHTKEIIGPIKFIKECNLIELSDDIDEDLWLNDTITLDIDCFSTDDDILEYMGAHSKLPRSNEKKKISYILNEYAYFE